MIFNINVPYVMLKGRIGEVGPSGLNPEIYFSWRDLEGGIEGSEDLAGKLKEWGRRITFHGPFMDLNLGAEDPLVREVTLKRMESLRPFVDVFEPVIVVIHGGYDPVRYDFDPGHWFDLARGSLEKVLRMFDGEVILAIENVFDRDPHPLWALLDEFRGEKVGFCFDVGHAFFLGRVPLEYWIDVLGEFLVEVHLHDNHGFSDEHLPMGMGSINFSPLFRRFKSMESEPIYTLEVHREEDVRPAIEGFERFYSEC